MTSNDPILKDENFFIHTVRVSQCTKCCTKCTGQYNP